VVVTWQHGRVATAQPQLIKRSGVGRSVQSGRFEGCTQHCDVQRRSHYAVLRTKPALAAVGVFSYLPVLRREVDGNLPVVVYPLDVAQLPPVGRILRQAVADAGVHPRAVGTVRRR
jgi:hypothetical protein